MTDRLAEIRAILDDPATFIYRSTAREIMAELDAAHARLAACKQERDELKALCHDAARETMLYVALAEAIKARLAARKQERDEARTWFNEAADRAIAAEERLIERQGAAAIVESTLARVQSALEATLARLAKAEEALRTCTQFSALARAYFAEEPYDDLRGLGGDEEDLP